MRTLYIFTLTFTLTNLSFTNLSFTNLSFTNLSFTNLCFTNLSFTSYPCNVSRVSSMYSSSRAHSHFTIVNSVIPRFRTVDIPNSLICRFSLPFPVLSFFARLAVPSFLPRHEIRLTIRIFLSRFSAMKAASSPLCSPFLSSRIPWVITSESFTRYC